MSRYNKMMTEVLDSIFEGYTLDDKSGKLVVVNEAATLKAQEQLHTLVLEKARELWDQLEASQESLASVAEEIRFEELNTDPSSMSSSVSQSAAPEADTAAPAGIEAAPALESAGSIAELLSTDDLNLDDIFENMDQLDNHQNTNVPRGPDMPFDEMTGGMSAGNIGGAGFEAEGDIEDGGDDFDALSMGMGDDGGMGDPEMGDPEMGDGEMGIGDEFGDEGGEMGMDGEMGMGDEFGDEGDDMGGFDFDLDLEDPEMGGDLAVGGEDDLGMGGEDDLGIGGEEEEMEGLGQSSMRMEGKGEKPDFMKKDDDKDDDKDDKDDKKDDDKDSDDDDDDDDDDKPDFLKKKKDD